MLSKFEDNFEEKRELIPQLSLYLFTQFIESMNHKFRCRVLSIKVIDIKVPHRNKHQKLLLNCTQLHSY